MAPSKYAAIGSFDHAINLGSVGDMLSDLTEGL